MPPIMLVNDVDKNPITVSPSGLNDAFDTPHLYWLEKRKKIAWPRGIFPSLPSGIDKVLKAYYDGHRAAQVLPIEVRNHGVTGIPHPNQDMVKKFRAGGKAMPSTVVTETVNGVIYGVTLRGMVDDVFLEPDGALTVWDNKTKGSAPKQGDTEAYYGRQANGYALLFQALGYKTSGKGHFAYYYPNHETVPNPDSDGLRLSFSVKVETVSALAMAAERDIKTIIRLLVGPCPPMNLAHEKYDFIRDYSAYTQVGVSA